MKKTILAIFPIFLISLISCHDDSNNLGKDLLLYDKR